jgi:hypothetical protein
MNARLGNECPPAVGAAEGRCIAVEANAGATYCGDDGAGKRAVGVGKAIRRSTTVGAAFRSSAGVVWRYSGKRARVLAMLATSRSGVTQWDTLPWHTRLGGTIHVLREDGLSIETVREGEYRHARYWLRTSGALDEGSIA